VTLQLGLTFREFEAEDLGDVAWSGEGEHAHALAEALMASYSGQVVLLVGVLGNGRLVAAGGLDFRPSAEVGTLWMLSVHETFQGLGVGTALIGALEDRVRAAGLGTARLTVEHDNPRAEALYRRLGYVAVGSAVESWPVAGGRTYVTVTTVLEHPLR
jgi:ribosomal protein S18 acetylase RimI-like enzyme